MNIRCMNKYKTESWMKGEIILHVKYLCTGRSQQLKGLLVIINKK